MIETPHKIPPRFPSLTAEEDTGRMVFKSCSFSRTSRERRDEMKSFGQIVAAAHKGRRFDAEIRRGVSPPRRWVGTVRRSNRSNTRYRVEKGNTPPDDNEKP